MVLFTGRFGGPDEPPSNMNPTFIQHADYDFGVAGLRTAPGMRERSPGAWELIVEAGRDPVTGKRRQASRIFNGTLTEAKKARAALITEVSKGRHTGTKATMNDLFDDWIVELQRKGRSPNTVHGYEKIYNHNIKPTLGRMAVTKVTTKTLTDLYGEHQRRGLSARSVHHIHGCLSSMFTQACRWGWRDSNPAQWAEPPSIPNITPVVPTPEEVRALDRCRRAVEATGVCAGDSGGRDYRIAASRAVWIAALARLGLGARPDASVDVGCLAAGTPARRDPDEEPAGSDACRR